MRAGLSIEPSSNVSQRRITGSRSLIDARLKLTFEHLAGRIPWQLLLDEHLAWNLPLRQTLAPAELANLIRLHRLPLLCRYERDDNFAARRILLPDHGGISDGWVLRD